ncbi:metallo-beta-lactamase/rhodanese-like domain-containing protein [Rhodopirellula baltica SH28]|uniref:Metallo-beta-lactamase/rhodanese-like domain-containing protein n=1 Tax=Rhodopirellula baltica SH28 TaxID=993517 RepID=K5CJZ2_RHOBT|nr:MBL fold metallo-hydrolase [Rhodopirellula baltica]EKK04395.1 metallo-beta-lactamase/rhodanese-like domain-containing protein [Rhodopirellula baltica SH28]
MLLKYFYDDKLAHASYLVGCQRAREAIVIDPGRDIEGYLAMAEREGLTITAVAETHIHADYVSGARELADRVGAKLYVSDEGPAEWKYLYLDGYTNQLLHDGDSFSIGKIKFDVMHTPGHTPESLSFVLTDQGGGATSPMGIFTGDFVFVGSIGRPDLLEEAAGIAGTAEPGAKDLFASMKRFRALPDHLQVWPAHGAGSACGKGLGAIPSSTVGYEKLTNPALQYDNEESFVRYILADQPEAPKYFAVMKRVNKEGPRVLGEGHHHQMLDLAKLHAALKSGTVIDLAPSSEFAKGHVPGAINIPIGMLATWAGWLVDYDKPTYLICKPEQLEEAARVLHKIGVEEIIGAFDAHSIQASGEADEVYSTAKPSELLPRIESDRVTLIDVRSNEEWNEGHIQNANHYFLGRLPSRLSELPKDKTVVVHCLSGARSSIAASVLQANGVKDVINMEGGYKAWVQADLPKQKETVSLSS